MANNGNGAHVMIVDADIQFNFWDLSARSLCNALITPLDQLPVAMVCLNAPRSFYADDAIVHLWCFLFTYAVYGVRIHQVAAILCIAIFSCSHLVFFFFFFRLCNYCVMLLYLFVFFVVATWR